MAEPQRVTAAIVVAAGSGSRFDPSGPRKQYRELCGIPLLVWSLRPFIDHPAIVRTVVVLPADDVDSPPEWLASLPVTVVAGGAERGDSVRNGLAVLDAEQVDLVLIHDGARPLITPELIDRVLSAGDGISGVVPGLPITDTVKQVGPDGLVTGTLVREQYWRVQTPQAFPLDALRATYERAWADRLSKTDDAALFEHYGLPVRMVEGDAANIKVTTLVDFKLAEILACRLPPSR